MKFDKRGAIIGAIAGASGGAAAIMSDLGFLGNTAAAIVTGVVVAIVLSVVLRKHEGN